MRPAALKFQRLVLHGEFADALVGFVELEQHWGVLSASQRLLDYCNGGPSDWMAPDLVAPVDVLRHAKSLLLRAIEADARLGALDRTTGSGVETVFVDATGAHLQRA